VQADLLAAPRLFLRHSLRHAAGTAVLWAEHDLFRKPVSTFRDHALNSARTVNRLTP